MMLNEDAGVSLAVALGRTDCGNLERRPSFQHPFIILSLSFALPSILSLAWRDSTPEVALGASICVELDMTEMQILASEMQILAYHHL